MGEWFDQSLDEYLLSTVKGLFERAANTTAAEVFPSDPTEPGSPVWRIRFTVDWIGSFIRRFHWRKYHVLLRPKRKAKTGEDKSKSY